MTILFTALVVIGVVETIALVVASVVLSRSDRASDREVVSVRLMGQAAALMSAGAGGLAMTLGGTGAPGFAVVTLASWILVMTVMYAVVLPLTRRWWPAPR
jgi:hypothetical protein